MTSTSDLGAAFDANRAAQFLLGERLDVFEDFTATSGLILSLADTYADKADEIADSSSDIVKGLKALSVLPKIGTAAKVFSKVYGKVDKAVQNVNDRVQDLEAKLQDTAGTFLEDLEAALDKAREISDEGIAINSDYLDAIAQLEAALDATNAGDPDLGLPADAIIIALDQITGGIGAVLEETDPIWEALEAGADGFAKAAEELASLEKTLCDIRDIAVQISGPLAEIEAVLEPVDWAINASAEIFDDIVAPVLDPILDATGIESLLNEFTSIFDPLLVDLELLQDGLFEVDANFEVSFDAGTYTVPFLEDLFTGWQDIAPQFSLEATPFLDIDAYLAALPNPPSFTFDFDPTLNFNLFSIPSVEFVGPFGDLIDLPDPAFEIDGPNGPAFYWLGIRNVENLLAATGLETEVFGSDALIGDDIFVLSLGDDSLNLGINIGDADVAAFTSDLPNYLLTDESGSLQSAGSDLRSEGRGDENALEGSDTIENAEFLLFTDEGLGLVASSEVQNFNYTNFGGNGNSLTGADDNTEREFLIGDANANALFGRGGNDVLLGDDGNDNLEGGAGDDLILGGAGNDSVALFLEAGDTDTILGGDGDADRIFLEDDIDTAIDLEGGTINAATGYQAEISGFERVTGAGGNDTISLGQDIEERTSAGDGDDLVLNVGFNDQANGNDGFDIVGFDPDAWAGIQVQLFGSGEGDGISDVVGVYDNPNAANPTEAIIGNFEGAIGTNFSDYIVANYQGDSAPGQDDPTLDVAFNGQTVTVTGSYIQGAAGNDVIVAGGGDDLLIGGDGFDVASYNGAFGSGSGVTTSFRPLDINLETGIVQPTGQNSGGATPGTDTIAGFEAVVGTQKNDSITGDAGDNALYGGDGDDTINGGDGDDIIDGGDGAANILNGGAGDDLFFSRSESDVINGGEGFDVLDLEIASELPIATLVAPDLATALDDIRIENEAGAQVDLDAQLITRTLGPTSSNTGNATDTSTVASIEGVYGTEFGDTLLGSSAVAGLGGSADASGDNFFNGRAGDDVIDGRSGNDVLVGGLGADTLMGGDGDDTLIANGSGAEDTAATDQLTGGAGVDVFGLDVEGTAIVTDFQLGVDMLDVRATGATFDDLTFNDPGAASLDSALANALLDPVSVTEVILDGEVIAILEGVEAGDISAADVLTSTQAGDDAFALDLASGGALPDLLANDTESSLAQSGASGLKITEIDGIPIDPGETIVLSSGAEISMAADGSLTLSDPNDVFADLIGTSDEDLVTFDYTVSDDAGGTASAGVEITVSNSTNPVDANDDTAPAPIAEGTDFIDQDVLSNDGGQGLSIISAASDAGDVSILPGGTLRLAPEENFSGQAIVDYTIEDAFGQRDSAEWRVDVTNTDDDAPETTPDVAGTEGTDPVVLDVLANDEDPEGADLTITNASAQNGTVGIINGGKALSYQADPGFDGVDKVDYTTTDGTQSSAGTANVAVSPPLLSAEDDTGDTDEDTAAIFAPLANDIGTGLGLISASAKNGTVQVLSETELRYVPNPDFFGQDTINYTVGDDYGQSDEGDITVDVAGTNDAPVAAADTAETTAGTEVIIDVLANDTDADSDPLSILSASAANGQVAILADNRLSYVPDAGFTGEDDIIYLLSDGFEEVEGEVDVTVEEAPPPTQAGGEDDGGFGGLGIALGLLVLLAAFGGGF